MKKKNGSIETSQNLEHSNHQPLEWEKRMRRLLKPSINLKDHPQSIHHDVDVRRNDGLRKKRRHLWLDNGKAMHDGQSPGPLAIQFVFRHREWGCVVSAIYDEWQKGTHVDGKLMQPTTNITNRLQLQHTIGHAHPITLLNANYKIHSHVLAWWLRKSQSIMRASVSVPTDSVPTTQSPKREVGTIMQWPQARAC